LRSALASICRIRSRVTLKSRPTSSSVRLRPVDSRAVSARRPGSGRAEADDAHHANSAHKAWAGRRPPRRRAWRVPSRHRHHDAPHARTLRNGRTIGPDGGSGVGSLLATLRRRAMESKGPAGWAPATSGLARPATGREPPGDRGPPEPTTVSGDPGVVSFRDVVIDEAVPICDEPQTREAVPIAIDRD